MKNISKFKKIVIGSIAGFALATSFALSNADEAKADYPYLLFRHNAYEYNYRGHRANRVVIRKHMTKGYLGSRRIRGRKYFKIGRNKYVKAANVTTHSMTRTFTLIRNTYLYGSNGKINRHYHGALKAGEQYFYIREVTIKGEDYFQVGGGIYVKQSATKEGNTYDMTTSSDVYNGNGYNYHPSKSHNSNSRPSVTTGSDSEYRDNKTQVSPNRYGTNRIVLPSGYLQGINSLGNENTNEYMKSLCRKGMQNNDYHTESSSEDHMKVNIKHLTPSQNREISLFALNIINDWRKQAGAEPLKYDSKSQQVADFVKQKYEIDKAGITTMHDMDALSYATEKAGLDTYPAECMGGQQVTSPSYDIHTMTQLKRAVYRDLRSMVFNSFEFDHAKVLIKWHSLDDRQTEFGWSISWRDRSRYGKPEWSTHYILY